RQPFELAGKVAKAGVLDRVHLHCELRDPLPHAGIVPGAPPVAQCPLRQRRQLAHLAHQSAVMAARALEHQSGDRDVPSLVLLADDIGLGHATSSKKTWLKPRAPVIWTRGRTVTPGVFI